jgi:hypothetical protein
VNLKVPMTWFVHFFIFYMTDMSSKVPMTRQL